MSESTVSTINDRKFVTATDLRDTARCAHPDHSMGESCTGDDMVVSLKVETQQI